MAILKYFNEADGRLPVCNSEKKGITEEDCLACLSFVKIEKPTRSRIHSVDEELPVISLFTFFLHLPFMTSENKQL